MSDLSKSKPQSCTGCDSQRNRDTVGAANAPDLRPRFWENYTLSEMTQAEWEALCDGCGKCCLHKLEDEETGRIYRTNVACRLLDRETGLCSDYANRREFVPDCVQLTPDLVPQLDWLPGTCGYRRVAEKRPLPAWHYLVSGEPEAIHEVGASVRGWVISEVEASEDLEDHIIEPN